MTVSVLYKGPSMIDGEPIVALATGIDRPSSNRKTGDMIQTWIMRADLSPIVAAGLGADFSVCGACPHRGDGYGNQRSCYVVIAQAPTSAWMAWSRAGQPSASLASVVERCAGRMIRLGAYGDPCAVPAEVWRQLIDRSSGWTGYTHQWRRLESFEYQGFLMASVDSAEEQRIATSQGWRTFRVGSAPSSKPMQGEIPCIATVTNKTCAQCRLCSGSERKSAPSIHIVPHGTGARYVTA